MNPNDLLKINVNDHTEKKNGLTYLSWAWAWAEALKADPAANFKVELFDGKCYMDVNGTGMVWVTVTIFGKPMTCMLPVMDYKNKAIPSPDAFAVNTAIMRCMTKALSLHGLGLYIYAGEDLPMNDNADIKTIDGLTDYLSAISAAATEPELIKAFKEGYAACKGDEAWQNTIIKAKDAMKKKLGVA